MKNMSSLLVVKVQESTVLGHVINGKKGIVVVHIDGETTLSNFKQNSLKPLTFKLNHGMKVIFCSKSNSSFRKISTSLWKNLQLNKREKRWKNNLGSNCYF